MPRALEVVVPEVSWPFLYPRGHTAEEKLDSWRKGRKVHERLASLIGNRTCHSVSVVPLLGDLSVGTETVHSATEDDIGIQPSSIAIEDLNRDSD